jgi:hypothetical protein
MRGADRDTLAAGGAAATEHGGTGVGLHARPEAVSFRTVAAVGLKGTFGHGNPLLFSKENLLFSNSLSISQAKFGIHPEALSRCGKGVERFVVCSEECPQKSSEWLAASAALQ